MSTMEVRMIRLILGFVAICIIGIFITSGCKTSIEVDRGPITVVAKRTVNWDHGKYAYDVECWLFDNGIREYFNLEIVTDPYTSVQCGPSCDMLSHC